MELILADTEKTINSLKFNSKSKKKIILLNSYYTNKKKNILSIHSIIDKNKYFYRELIIKKLSNIGNIIYKKKKIQNYFLIEKFNFWECSVFKELILYGDNNMLLFLKIIVIENFLKNYKENFKILNYSKDTLLNEILKQYANNKKISYLQLGELQKKKNINLINYIPSLLKFFLYIAYILIFHTSFKKKQNKKSVVLFDIFTHLNFKFIKKNLFFSNYWSNLPILFNKKNIKTRWLHIFYPQSDTKYPFQAIKFAKKISDNKTEHEILDIISPFDILIIIKNYFRLYKNTIIIKKFLKNFYYSKSINIYKIFKNDFENFFIGGRGVKNILYYQSIKKNLNQIKKYNYGFYIYENQNWEKILNFFWNKYNHKKLYAVPHNEIRFWDLRFFDLYPSKFYENYLKPKYFIINSKNSLFLHKKFKFENVYHAESLRMINFKTKFTQKFRKRKNILVTLDLFNTTSHKLLNILNNSINELNNIGNIYIKDHPASDISKIYKFAKKIIFTKKHIKDILPKIDIIIASNTTTSVYYAIYNKIPYVTFLDSDLVNFSPIYPKNFKFFYDKKTFKNIINNNLLDYSFDNKYYKFSNVKIPQWNKLINKITLR